MRKTKEHGGHLHEGGRLVHFHQHTEELSLRVKDDLGIDFVTTLMTLIMTMMKMMTMSMMTNTCLHTWNFARQQDSSRLSSSCQYSRSSLPG